MSVREAFRLAYGLCRADLAAAAVGWGTTTQAWASIAFFRAIEAARGDDAALDILDHALDAALQAAA